MDGKINTMAIRTHAEVARILTARGIPMTTRQVWHDEHRAFLKLRPKLLPVLDPDAQIAGPQSPSEAPQPARRGVEA